MTTLLLLLLAATAASIATWHAVHHADIGYEDAAGFHYGRPTDRPRTVSRCEWHPAAI